MPGQIKKLAGVEAWTSRNEDIFPLLVAAVHEYAIFALDPDGTIVTWNAGARRLKGYEADEVVGTHFERFYTPEDRARKHPQAELEIAREKGYYGEEGWRVRKDGSLFWASVTISVLRDPSGTLHGFAKVTRDLSAKKEAEEALRQSEERFRLMIEGVKDYAIFMLDPSGRIVTWNEGASRNKGYSAAEIIGRHFSEFYPPEDVAAGKPKHELEVAAAEGRFEDTGWRVRKNGSLFWANVIITAVSDSSGKLIGFSKVTRDLTERKLAEDALREAYQTLEKRVIERTAELEQAKNAAERAAQIREEFLSIASHELRTPLTSLRLKVQMMARKAQTSGVVHSPESMDKFVRDVGQQLDRLNRLVEDMLDVARASQGQLALSFETVPVCEAVQHAIEVMGPQFREKGVVLDFVASPDVRNATANLDRVRFEQVLTNLFTNALRYAPGSPVRVEIDRAQERIRVSVTDQGPGIPKENQERIFNRYERLVPSQNVSGLGIGLYLCRAILKALGGSIHVESEPGRGARFVITLPGDAVKENP